MTALRPKPGPWCGPIRPPKADACRSTIGLLDDPTSKEPFPEELFGFLC